MEMNEYQLNAERTALYPGAGTGNSLALAYVSLGLAGEAGEIANKIKKILRGDANASIENLRENIKAELGDVLWYIAMLSSEFGLDLEDVADTNLLKLAKRLENNSIKGSGDVR